MRLWWVSMSLFMELEGEQGVVIFSCCSSNGIPHWLMRLERSEELVVVSSSFTSSTSSNSWKRDMVDSLVEQQEKIATGAFSDQFLGEADF